MKKFKILLLLLTFSFLFFKFPAKAEAAATLSLSPASKTVGIGQSFNVTVLLNTGSSNTDAADVIINYDAARLQLVTSTAGTLYDETTENSVATPGKVTIRAKTTATSYFSGSGVFATLTFKGKALGAATVSFDFQGLNIGTDCNVAYAGSDILGSVANASYTVQQEATGEATATPTGPDQPETGGLTPTLTLSIFGTFFMVLGALALLF